MGKGTVELLSKHKDSQAVSIPTALIQRKIHSIISHNKTSIPFSSCALRTERLVLTMAVNI